MPPSPSLPHDSPTRAHEYDFIVIGSGFGGSVCALRLAEKGHRVLVLEQGRRFSDADFPSTNWRVRDFLWMPALGLRGFLQLTFLREVMVLHGCGVGGGSLGYANVLMEPDPEYFEDPEWRRLTDWRRDLRPHYETARRMLGVVPTPELAPADRALAEVAAEFGHGHTARPTQVGVFFGEPGVAVPDPYFGGQGPARAGCTYCGGCMVGCRYNAKNTLVKNYLYLAEQHGAEIRAETRVTGIFPLDGGYRVEARRSTRPWSRAISLRATNVVVSAGTLGTLELLHRCRASIRSLPRLSPRLGENVRTNSEALLGSGARRNDVDYSKGLAISSDARVDEVTHVQPVRYPAGSSFMRLLSSPLVEGRGRGPLVRLAKVMAAAARHPLDVLRAVIGRRWAERTTILLVMQRLESSMTIRWGRPRLPLWPAGLQARRDPNRPAPGEIPQAHAVVRAFAARTDGVPMGNVAESLFGMSATAHLIGGCPMGESDAEGVVDRFCRVHNYPGLYVVDGTVLPANPGINPSLTITALAEYAMSHVPPRARAPGPETLRRVEATVGS